MPSPDFWDSAALQQEALRQFDVCGTCRLCVTFCPSFPAMFDAIDDHDGDASALTLADTYRITELCFLCELCFLRCPYTPPHEWQMDVPDLLRRAKAVRAKEEGVPLRDRLVGDVERVGSLGRLTAPLANLAGSLPPTRLLLEKTLGIDRRAILPRFHWQTFAKWFRSRTPSETPGRNGKVAFFHSCMVNHNRPDIGAAAVQVLEHNGVEVALPPQRDCGMPYVDMGQLEHAMGLMERNVASLLPWVEDGYAVVVPEPTCGMMLKKEYPRLLDTPEARTVAENTYDISEFLLKLHKEGRLETDFTWAPGSIAYHMPCHLRHQQMGNLTAQLLGAIPGAAVHFVDRGCSGHDGTWGMKAKYYDMGMRVARRLFEGVTDADADLVVTDCSLAALQIQQGTGREALHPIEVVKRAYGL